MNSLSCLLNYLIVYPVSIQIAAPHPYQLENLNTFQLLNKKEINRISKESLISPQIMRKFSHDLWRVKFHELYIKRNSLI